jgi:hypothetical protein
VGPLTSIDRIWLALDRLLPKRDTGPNDPIRVLTELVNSCELYAPDLVEQVKQRLAYAERIG